MKIAIIKSMCFELGVLLICRNVRGFAEMKAVVITTGRINANIFCVTILKLINSIDCAPVTERISALSIVVIIRQSKNAQISSAMR
jgi:hypothetical protein